MHQVEVLREYRRRTGIAANLVVVGLVPNCFTIADPADAGMLDLVGFDTATPGGGGGLCPWVTGQEAGGLREGAARIALPRRIDFDAARPPPIVGE